MDWKARLMLPGETEEQMAGRIAKLARKTTPKMPRNPKPRLQRALELREPAITIANVHGRWLDTPEGKQFYASYCRFGIEYRTPFQKSGPPPRMIAQGLAIGLRFEQLPYGLQIWGPHHSDPKNGRRLMAFEWDDNGKTKLSEFRSGEWEELIRDAAKSLQPNAA